LYTRGFPFFLSPKNSVPSHVPEFKIAVLGRIRFLALAVESEFLLFFSLSPIPTGLFFLWQSLKKRQKQLRAPAIDSFSRVLRSVNGDLPFCDLWMPAHPHNSPFCWPFFSPNRTQNTVWLTSVGDTLVFFFPRTRLHPPPTPLISSPKA